MSSHMSNDMDAFGSCLQNEHIDELEGTQLSVQNAEEEVNEEIPVPVVDENYENDNQVSKPFIGMTFDSEDDAYAYYNLYAKSVGFSVRRHYSHKSRRTKKVISHMLVCSKEGRKNLNNKQNLGKEVKRRRDVREDCHAHFLVCITNDNKWILKKFHDVHTHPVIAPPKVSRLYSHNRLTSKEASKALHECGTSSSMIAVAPNLSNEPLLLSQNFMDYLNATQQDIGKECMSVIAYFRKKQNDEEGFFTKWKLDENNNVKVFFWADGRSRDAYMTFGDIIICDTIYRINGFPLSFVPFTGVNHHRKSTLFGCALIDNETEDTFAWLFRSLLECIYEKYPLCIITKQGIGITNAICEVFPKTQHIFCVGHPWKNAVSKLRDLCALGNFQEDYEKWIYESVSIEEFEGKWLFLKQKYNIPNGHWVESIYNERHHWVPLYLDDVFCAGMCSIQGAESVNSFFDSFINSKTPPSQFVYQYEQALYTRRWAEEQDDFKTLNNKVVLISTSPLESHAGKVYTEKVFNMFQEEFKKMLTLWWETISEDNKKGVYSVFLAGNEDDRKNIVEYNKDVCISISCSCKKFEREGIFCTHILLVLSHKKFMSLPEQYVLHRWTIDARYAKAHIVHDKASTSPNGRFVAPLQKFTLRANAWKFIDMSMHSLDHLEAGMSLLNEAIQKLEGIGIVNENASQSYSVEVPASSSADPKKSELIIHDPIWVTSNGKSKKSRKC